MFLIRSSGDAKQHSTNDDCQLNSNNKERNVYYRGFTTIKNLKWLIANAELWFTR